MTKPLKICFWCTTFQADNQALATYLTGQPGFETVVAIDAPKRYTAEPVERLLPFRGRFVDRAAKSTLPALERWAPDILIIDNHLPPKQLAPRIFVLWHGFGWRVDDLSVMRKQLKAQIGDVGAPNQNFHWQAFGDWDRSYRIEHSQLDPSNVTALGSAYSDLLRPSSEVQKRFAPAMFEDAYSLDLAQPTVLLGLSWHHGGALGHWGDDAQLHERLVSHIGRAGANVLIRMHDRHRYDNAAIANVESLAARFPHVALKFKSEHPDSLVDILLSDVMISNYSSFLNAFYYTTRPTIHIDPIAGINGPHVVRALKRGKLRASKVARSALDLEAKPRRYRGASGTFF